MMISKTSPSLPTGHTLTELFELGYLKVISGSTDTKKAHSLGRKTFYKYYKCIKCNFVTKDISDVRYNKGCHVFANSDTRKFDWYHRPDLYDSPNYKPRYMDLPEEPTRGCNTHDRSEWVKYSETGKAWQEDKFINEQVKKELKRGKD